MFKIKSVTILKIVVHSLTYKSITIVSIFLITDHKVYAMCMSSRYPEKTMQLVAELSKGVADDHREKQKGKLKRTFVQASDAAGAKVKGRNCELK